MSECINCIHCIFYEECAPLKKLLDENNECFDFIYIYDILNTDDELDGEIVWKEMSYNKYTDNLWNYISD